MEPTPNTEPVQPGSLDYSPQQNVAAPDGLLETLPWGVLVVDEQRIIRRINQQAAHWCGAPPGDLLGQPLDTTRLPAAVSATLRQVVEPGGAVPHEVWLPRLEQWITLAATRQPDGWVIYAQDITPQKQREQQYQALADNTPDVLTRWGPDLCLRYANPALADKVGVPLTALLGKTKAEMGLPEEVTGPYMAALRRVFDTGQPQELTHALPTARGVLTYHSRLVPELHDGQIETVLGIARDLTELHQTQAEALRLRDALTQQATDKYHALFHSMGQGFALLDLLFDEAGGRVVDFRFLELNPTFARQSAMPADVQGRTAREVSPDLEPFWYDTYGQVARTGETTRLEYYAAKAGRWLDVHVFRVGAAGSHQLGVLFNDITARKLAADTLAASEEQFRTVVNLVPDLLWRSTLGSNTT